MESTPLVSIIVPVYNVEKYINRCVESVVSQTFTDWELLLIDDGSPDKSGELCDVWSKHDSRIKVFHKKNGGVSSARNLGIKEAKGKWLYFIDSDDYIESETLEKTIEKTNYSDPNLIVHGLVNDYLYNGKSKYISYKIIREGNYNDIIEYTDKCGLLKGPVCKLFNYQIIKENCLEFDESICYGEDTKFTFEYLQKCHTIKFVPAHFYHYCFREEESLTKKVYSYTEWDKSANMLLKVRLPIMTHFSMPNSYYQYIRFEYISHISRAIYSMYSQNILKSDRIKYLKYLHCNKYLKDAHKDLKYLNRLIYLIRFPLIMDLIMVFTVKHNKKIF